MAQFKKHECYIKVSERHELPILTLSGAVAEFLGDRSGCYLYSDIKAARSDLKALLIAMIIETEGDIELVSQRDLFTLNLNRVELIDEKF